MEKARITSISFRHYKAFSNYSVSLNRFNVLVGPNNCGKSTILGAIRILAEALRRANSRNPLPLTELAGDPFGYRVDLAEIPVATENVFYNYDERETPLVKFRVSNGNHLLLHFPSPGFCCLTCETTRRSVTSTSSFRREFPVTVGFVPILGPVEHDEPLYKVEAARLALLSHRAARNFRNIWFHYSDEFEEFRSMLKSTWPGMDIEQPEVDTSHDKPLLRMFCPEERIPRELFWAGFGFQVWCQMLTYIIRGRDSSVFLIDEPDIYLHADLQRQLVSILRSLGPDIVIATHSTEIITESDPDDLLVISKRGRAAKRLNDPTQLQRVFNVLGSNLNPILTQIAKTRRALFLEGKDFQILSRFAHKLGRVDVANRADFAVVPVSGFNPGKVRDFVAGVEATLSTRILAGVIFDRDYRSEEERVSEEKSMLECVAFAHIHQRKEIENFLFALGPLERAIEHRLKEVSARTGRTIGNPEPLLDMLNRLTQDMRLRIQAKYLSKRRPFTKSQSPHLDDSTIDESILTDFEREWSDQDRRLRMVPGKELLTDLNRLLQSDYGVTISIPLIIQKFTVPEVPSELVELVERIEQFRRQRPVDAGEE